MSIWSDLYGLPPEFLYLRGETWLGMPVSIWIAGLLYIGLGLLLGYHERGRALYAIGGNPEAPVWLA